MQNAQIEKAIPWNPWHGCHKCSPGWKGCFEQWADAHESLEDLLSEVEGRIDELM